MSNYFVKFTAPMDQRKRPENFPDEVSVVNLFYNVQNTEHLKQLVNQKFVELVTSAGLVVMKDPNAVIEQNMVSFDKRIFVPWHMLTSLTVEVKNLVEAPERNPQDSIVPPEEPPASEKEIVN
jgi:hypothetical protein